MPDNTVMYASGPDIMSRSLLEMVQMYISIPNIPDTFSCIKILDLQTCAICTCVTVT